MKKLWKYTNTPNLHQMVLETVQSLKNRIIFKIYGQFQSGLPIFRKKKTNRNLWRIKLMNNKRIIIGVTIGIIAAILWSVVFINVLNSMAGIGIGICLGISFGISGSLIFSKKDKDKWWYNFQFIKPFEKSFLKGLFNFVI